MKEIQKEKEKVQDQLDASDEYVTSQFGDDFPTGARLTSDDEIEASPIGNQVHDRFSPSERKVLKLLMYVVLLLLNQIQTIIQTTQSNLMMMVNQSESYCR